MQCLLHSATLSQRAKPFAFAGASTGTTGWAAAEGWAYNKLDTWTDAATGLAGATVRGVAHFGMVKEWRDESWGDHSYERFDLRGKTMRFYVDQSGMRCRCAGTLYFSFAPEPSPGSNNACGINTGEAAGYDGGPCTEVDVMEAK